MQLFRSFDIPRVYHSGTKLWASGLAAMLVSWATACGGARAANMGAGDTAADAVYDVVIVNGRVVDGAGNAWFYGDVAVRGDRIAKIVRRGSLPKLVGRRTIDATGMVVAPGFIDIQAGGNYVSGDGRDVSKVTQGITTEIFGEASTGAPISERSLENTPAAAAAASRQFMGPRGFDAWLRAMETHGISPNVGSFVGASTLRQYAMGMHMGAAGAGAMDSMRIAMRNAMEDGAFGLGTALIYPPGNYASTEELIEIAKTMAPYGGIYITHMRSEADQVLEGMDEALRIGREGGVPVEIYHLKAAGVANWKKEAAMIAKIDSARAAGFDVQATMYPYTAGGTGLAACLPPSASADGKLQANLASDAERAKIRAEVAHPTSFWESLCEQATPQGVLIAGLRSPDNEKWSGHRLSEISAAMGKDWLDTVMDLLRAEQRDIGTMYFLMNEDNVKLQLKQPWMIIGTDAGGSDPDSTKGLTHPRAYGTYPRILGKYVRDEHVLPLEDAVRKMTSAVAERLLITDRGQLRPGMYADVVVFDPQRIQENSTYEKPLQLSTGMQVVLINGVEVVHDGRHTGAKPGRIVRGSAWRPAGS
ncbi:MAG: D-aminoacylase domain protein [Gemmatimonadetes bacterium]|nr:D-aminoacylase domain protein [Gemmatimonadota bacterium]